MSQAISVRVKHRPAGKYTGDRNHDLRRGRMPSYVDLTRSAANRVLVKPPTRLAMHKITLQRRDEGPNPPTRELRTNAAIATTAIITFGTKAQALVEAQPPETQDQLYRQVAEAICDRYDVELRGLVVHADESSPHAHAVFDCRTSEGRPLSKVLLGGELQDIAAEAAAEVIPGIERGVKKSARKARGEPTSAWVNRSVKELHEDLPAEIEELAAEIETRTAKLDTLETRIAGLETELKEKGELLANEAKRLVTYTNRLETQEAELEEKQAELEEKQARLAELEPKLAGLEARLAAPEAKLQAAEKLIGEFEARPIPMLPGRNVKAAREIEVRAVRDAAAAAEKLAAERQAFEEEQGRRRRDLEAELEAKSKRAEVAVEAIVEEIVKPDPAARGIWLRTPGYDQDVQLQQRWLKEMDPVIGKAVAGPSAWTDKLWSALCALRERVKDVTAGLTSKLKAANTRIATLTKERDAALEAAASASAKVHRQATELVEVKEQLRGTVPAAEAHHQLLFRGTASAQRQMITDAIKKGVDLNRRSDYGQRGTALHLAAVQARPAIVQQLLEAGAKPNATDAAGETPADMVRSRLTKNVDPATRAKLEKCIELLEPPSPSSDYSP